MFGVVRRLLRLKSALPTGLAWAPDLWYRWGEREIRFPPRSIGLCLSGVVGGGGGIVGRSGKCSSRETVQPVGIGINVIRKVSLTPIGGVAVLQEGWDCYASGSKWKFRKTAAIGSILLSCICCLGFRRLSSIFLAHRMIFEVLEVGVLSMRSRDN